MGFFEIIVYIFFKPFYLIFQGLLFPFNFIAQLLIDVVEDDSNELIEEETEYPTSSYELGGRPGCICRNRGSLISSESTDDDDTPVKNICRHKPLPQQLISPLGGADYHAINIPYIIRQHEKMDTATLVFNNKAKALREMKKYKDARFKSFQTYQEADEFTKLNLSFTIEDFSAMKATGLLEKGNYRIPRMIELLKMKELIETGQLKNFKQLITCNPYYLVSSGDTPPLLHVGARYNAFHIAAKLNKPEVIKIIFDVIQEPTFFCRLYGISDDIVCDRAERLIDFYLNTPDKGACETPLHFACKAGSKAVIEVLVNHPLTKLDAVNKFNKTPLELLPESMSPTVKKQIAALFSERCYLPLYGDEDNMSPPRVGLPCSPMYTCDVFSPPFSQVPSVNSPEGSPLSSHILPSVVKAYAGPMSPEQANDFRKNWKPSRDKDILDDTRSDQEKGYERLGRQLAQKYKLGWREYWNFLGVYTDISKSEGLEKLENYLQNQFLRFNVHHSLESLQITDSITSAKTIESLKTLKNVFAVDTNKNLSGYNQTSIPNDTDVQQQQQQQQNTSEESVQDLDQNNSVVSDKEEEEQGKETQSSKIFNTLKHFKHFKKQTNMPKDINDIMDQLAKEFGTKLVIVGNNQEQDSLLSSNTSWMDNVDTKDDHHHSVFTTLINFSDVYNTVLDNQPLSISLIKPETSSLLPMSPSKDNLTLPIDTVLLNISSPSGLNLAVPAKPARSPPKSRTNLQIYINGTEPSKLDLDVYRCIKDTDLDSRTYPYINKWYQKVKSFTADEQQTWRSPAKSFSSIRNQGPPSSPPCSHNQLGSSSRKTLFGSPNP